MLKHENPIIGILFDQANIDNMEHFLSKCDQSIVEKVKADYPDTYLKIIEYGIELAQVSSFQSLRYTEQSFNDTVYHFEHQIKEATFIWKGLKDDPVPFSEGHTYNKLYGLGFGDHILFYMTPPKQKPQKLYDYMERGICGHYTIKFFNGVELAFDIDEDGVNNRRKWLNKNPLYSEKEIIQTYALLEVFHKLRIRPSRNKFVYKVLREMIRTTIKVRKGEI